MTVHIVDAECDREVIVVLKFKMHAKASQAAKFVERLQGRLQVEVDAGVQVMHHETNVIDTGQPHLPDEVLDATGNSRMHDVP